MNFKAVLEVVSQRKCSGPSLPDGTAMDPKDRTGSCAARPGENLACTLKIIIKNPPELL